MDNNKSSYKKGLLTGILVTLIICTVCVTSILIFVYRSTNVLSPKVRSKIEYLTDMIDETYYQDIDISELQEGLYAGLIAGLDDKYSVYYSPKEAAYINAVITGEFSGLGATLAQDNSGEVKVRKVYEGSAAEEIGLRSGDIIIAADDKMAADMELSEFTTYTRGEEGTSFVLTYKRDGVETKATVIRKKVDIPSISYKVIDGDIGYIEISDFTKKTYDEYIAAIDDLKAQGIRGVIFDLRFNGGGLVESAAKILDEILPSGTIVSVERKNKKDAVYTSDEEKRLEMPIAVLVSDRTASAAEIFAGAIRDNHYGTLIGYKTYGKGVVQSSAMLKDGSMVNITSGRYFTPSGECINDKGIEPDIQLDLEYFGDESNGQYDEMSDNQIIKAIEVINK